MKNKILLSLWISCFLLLFIPVNAFSQPGGQIKLPDKRWINIGGGLRTSFTSIEDNAPSGSDTDATFDVENFRLYVNVLLTQNIEFEFK